jgi:hypothetical protein
MNHRVVARLRDPGCERSSKGCIPRDGLEMRSPVDGGKQAFVDLNTDFDCIRCVALSLIAAYVPQKDNG